MCALNRRDFLQTSLAAGAFLSVSEFAPRAFAAANEEINLAIIGLGVRGGEHINYFKNIPGVNIAALVEPDEKRLGTFLERYPKAKGYRDLRKVLEDDSIDAVTIATCNHWHCLAAIWAMEAGKDVYVEKPLSHSQWEGRQVVKAARKYNRIVQLGTQQRSSPIQEEIKQFLHEDQALGEIQYVQVCRYGVRGPIGKRATPLPIPKEVDYDLWLGPAADRPIYREKFHYDWHWDWNTGSGEMGNWGVHVLDDVRNVVFRDEVSLPTRVLAGGGRIAWNDAGESPNVHFAYFDTGKVPTYIGLSNLPVTPKQRGSLNYRGVSTGYLVQCEGGYYTGRRGGGNAFDQDGKEIRKFSGSSGNRHAVNFIEAIRSQDRSQLKAEIQVGHDSTGWCNLANIGFRAGQQFSPEEARESLAGDPQWEELLKQMTAHVEAHGLQMTDSEIRLSPMLEHNPKTEQFVGDRSDIANQFLKREYRANYQIPEII